VWNANKKIDGKEAFDMLMVGGPAGAAAAVYAARRAFTVVVETLAARRWIRWPLKTHFSQEANGLLAGHRGSKCAPTTWTS
jgi:thioredoxin reductase